MSPDSSQSSSDSVAAWQRLTSTGQKYTPYVVSCVKFWSAIIYADFICCVTLLSIYLILIYIYYQYHQNEILNRNLRNRNLICYRTEIYTLCGELCTSLVGENIHRTKFCDLTQIGQIHIIKY